MWKVINITTKRLSVIQISFNTICNDSHQNHIDYYLFWLYKKSYSFRTYPTIGFNVKPIYITTKSYFPNRSWHLGHYKFEICSVDFEFDKRSHTRALVCCFRCRQNLFFMTMIYVSYSYIVQIWGGTDWEEVIFFRLREKFIKCILTMCVVVCL